MRLAAGALVEADRLMPAQIDPTWVARFGLCRIRLQSGLRERKGTATTQAEARLKRTKPGASMASDPAVKADRFGNWTNRAMLSVATRPLP